MSSELVSNKPNFTQECKLLCTGLEELKSFFQNLDIGVMMRHENGEDHYINSRLMPPVEKAKESFDAMESSSAEQLEKVHRAVETSVSEQKTLSDGIKCVEKDEAEILTALEGKRQVVAIAKKQVVQKEGELLSAKNALGIAEAKLENARGSRSTTRKVVGFIAFVVPFTAPLAPVFLKNAQKAIEVAKQHTHTAEEEVSSSRKALQEAISSESKIKEELDQLHGKKKSIEQELHNLNESMEQLKGNQARIIEVNEKIQNFYTIFCRFHGRFEGLYNETTEGYSLSILQDASNPVVESVRPLLQCPVFCESGTLANLNFHLQQIEQVTRIEKV